VIRQLLAGVAGVIRYEREMGRDIRRLRRSAWLWGTTVAYRHADPSPPRPRPRWVDLPPLPSFVVPTGQPRLPE
jgi:hypothetical protein